MNIKLILIAPWFFLPVLFVANLALAQTDTLAPAAPNGLTIGARDQIFTGPYNFDAHEADINTVFGATTTPEWPRNANTTSTHLGNATDTCAKVQALLNTAGADDGNHIIAHDIDYGACPLRINASDIWLEMTDNSEFGGTFVCDSGAARVKITGGNIGDKDVAPSAWADANFNGCDDVLIDNVHFRIDDGQFQVGGINRFAMINSTIEALDYGLLDPPSTVDSDIIFANLDVRCNRSATGSPNNPKSCIRLQSVTRAIVADSRINAGDTPDRQQHTFRIHGASADILFVNNQNELTPSGVREFWLIHSPSTGQNGALSNIHLLKNTLFNDSNFNHNEGAAGWVGPATPSSCTGIVVDGNTTYNNLGGNFNFGVKDNVCSPVATVVTNNSAADLDAPPFNGVIPTFSGGADH